MDDLAVDGAVDAPTSEAMALQDYSTCHTCGERFLARSEHDRLCAVDAPTSAPDRVWAHEGPRNAAGSHVYGCTLPLDHDGFCGTAE